MISTGFVVLRSSNVSAVGFRFRGGSLDDLREKYNSADAVSK
jgi:hypothetical protein